MADPVATETKPKVSAPDPYEAMPWLALFDPDHPPSIMPQFHDVLAMFRAAVARAPERDAIRYFDGRISWRELDTLTDALAVDLIERGFQSGDRLGLYLQNVPQFVIGAVAAWKAGGIAVAINPMNRAREITQLFNDCTPKAVICHGSAYERVLAPLREAAGVHMPPLVYTTTAADFQTRNVPALFNGVHARRFPETIDLKEALQGSRGCKPAATPHYRASDIAFLVYTSGTTGEPKGAMCTHGNMAFNGEALRRWIKLEDGMSILGIAPLFHITGLICHVVASFSNASPLILAYRFEPGVMLDIIEEHKPDFAIGAITAYIAMMNHPAATPAKFASLTRVYSGGAPIPPTVVEEFHRRFGHWILPGYGMTETNAPTHIAPLGCRPPVDPNTGALSVGIPFFNTRAWICDDEGNSLPVGEIGEIVVEGPMIVSGYWQKPEETAQTIRQGRLFTGDIGFMDKDGWFYVVDRKKDMIIASGYKVWPRDVEDVLYTHPAVREAAVVPALDPYRGETVKAVISLKPGQSATPEEIIEFCKSRMAAYKYPRIVEIIDDLPKTVTGKILRRELRAKAASASH